MSNHAKTPFLYLDKLWQLKGIRRYQRGRQKSLSRNTDKTMANKMKRDTEHTTQHWKLKLELHESYKNQGENKIFVFFTWGTMIVLIKESLWSEFVLANILTILIKIDVYLCHWLWFHVSMCVYLLDPFWYNLHYNTRFELL